MRPGLPRDLGLTFSTACLALVLLGSPAGARAQEFTEFGLPIGNSTPQCIAPGPDGNLWFAERNFSKVGRITPAGTISEFPASGSSGTLTLRMQCITSGPDGNLWFTLTEGGSGQVGKITPGGAVTVFPTLLTPGRLFSITAGPVSDGALWFTESGTTTGKIGRVTTAGVVTEFPTLSAAGFFDTTSSIALGPDGNLWFTLMDSNKIGRLDPTRTSGCPAAPSTCISEFPLPTAGSGPSGVAGGPDGAIWFIEQTANKIGRMTTAGAVTGEFAIPTAAASAVGLTAGPDGNLWFTEQGKQKIGRITMSGEITDYSIPTANGSPFGIAKGPDGALWFTEVTGNKIGRITTGGAAGCIADGNTLCLNNGRFKVTVAWRVPAQGTSGTGNAVSLTGDTGYFWFFSSNNVELILKVVDGRAVNSHFWVFYGALSDVEYVITVIDTATGATRTYSNPSGQLTSASDTAAFPGLVSEPPGPEESGAPLPPPADAVERPSKEASPCTQDATTLCLNNGRFQAQVQWSVPPQGTSGPGMATAITGDTGNYWFFSSNNIELIIKLVDGRAVNNKFWFFSGALTNVAYTITITDTQTGAVKTYSNPFGTQASLVDTSAF